MKTSYLSQSDVFISYTQQLLHNFFAARVEIFYKLLSLFLDYYIQL